METCSYPLVAYTWTLISKEIAIKKIDRSVFLSKESGIPKEINHFFELDDMQGREKRFIQLKWNKVAYEACFYKDPSKSHRTKIRWKNDLDEELQLYFNQVIEDIVNGRSVPVYYEAYIEFIKVDATHYEIILRYKGHEICET